MQIYKDREILDRELSAAEWRRRDKYKKSGVCWLLQLAIAATVWLICDHLKKP